MSALNYRSLSYVVLLSSVAACGDGDSRQESADAPAQLDPGEGAIVQEEPEVVVPDEIGLPCDVKEFLAMHCQGCHGEMAKNGTTLLTRDDLLAASKKEPMTSVAERMALRMSDTDKPMPPKAKGEPVSEANLDMFLAWLDNEMPAGRCDDEP